ncbi:hypothetical protein Gotri_008146 [Gossypium trilobum]|uniref:Stress-associated endoplasmic reticulum protein n=6 Tax=Gossypium TaxID=3633 RepID=A0A7J9EIH9_9ROSI|nr:hypothetical protein [Gossypium trilobum]
MFFLNDVRMNRIGYSSDSKPWIIISVLLNREERRSIQLSRGLQRQSTFRKSPVGMMVTTILKWREWIRFSVLYKTTSRRLAERKVEKFQKNITKRGVVSETSTKKGKDYPVGPVLLGFFVFVVIGSCKILGS